MLKKFLLSAAALLFAHSLNAQKAQVTVDHFSGGATVTIPLLTIQSGACTLPLSLGYYTNGVKITDIGANTGRNWSLNAGGQISREVRGLPDDVKKDKLNNDRLGWLYNTKGAAISSFTIANDNNSSTCTDETADISYINSNFSDLADTEPDIFYVSAPGLSCTLVFDNNHVIKTIPYKDFKVTYTTSTTGTITSFTIVNDNGMIYLFSDAEVSDKITKSLTPTISYFKGEYDQYRNGITFNSTWKLTRMTDANGNVISIDYDQIDDLPEFNKQYVITSLDTVKLIGGGPSNGSIDKKQFTRMTTFIPKRILAITYGNANPGYTGAVFEYSFINYETPVITKITGFGKTINLGYRNLSFLTNFSIGDRAYKFKYNGSIGDTTRMVPDSSTVQMDFWGNFNKTLTGSLKPQLYINTSNNAYERYRVLNPGAVLASYPYLLSGSNRNADDFYSLNAALEEITDPDGEVTTINYESNDFYDNTSGGVIKGGGIRVKKITHYDGINAANNFVQNFSYLNPLTGVSSGKPISLPAFAFTTPYTGSGTTQDLWNYSTVRSEINLSDEDNSVIYSHVKESRTGGGSTLYEFATPATNWDLTAGTDWTPTIVNIGRPSCTSYGFVRNDINTYPFPPNTNYEFERGLVKKRTDFNDAGTEVSETVYSYQRSGTPNVITGFKWEDNAGVKAYSKYKIYTSSSELNTQIVSKVFDSGTLTTSQQTTTNISYAGLQHKLPTQIENINSDGSISRTYTKYVKDFNASSALDSNSIAINNLQQLNINLPVEKYYKVERSGVNKTIGADLMKFKAFNPSGSQVLFLPSVKLKFVASNGVTDFVPATINSGLFSNDSRYVIAENDLVYNSSGILQSKDDNNKNVQSIISDVMSMKPTVIVSNASVNEIGFNNFENRLSSYTFTKDNDSYNYSLNSRTGKNSLALEALAGLSRTLTKSAKGDNYIFSIWINSTSAGNITLTLTNSASQVSSYNLAIINSAGKWKYYELKVPVINMSTSFAAKFQSNIALLVDDIFFYPENAEVNSIAYDPLSLVKTAETNTNGVSSYYSYDGLDRLRYVFDQDKQIVLKNTYVKAAANLAVQLSSSVTSNNYGVSVLNFRANYSNYGSSEGMTFDWDFGDGSTITSSEYTINHSYPRAGSYIVKVKVNSPFYSSIESQLTVNVSATFPITYTKISAQGAVTSIQFYQGGVLKKTISQTELIAGGNTLPQGVYDVKVYFTKGTGTSCKSIGWNTNDNGGSCFSSSSASPVILNSDFRGTSYLMVVVDTATCLL
jgi:YD repeat-containing protein